MQCPVCKNVNLLMSERQGIEIDYCPNCRGVWLDRGELDKIIERSADAPQAQSAENLHAMGSQGVAPRGPAPAPAQPGHRDTYHKRKKRGFLDELFDFD